MFSRRCVSPQVTACLLKLLETFLHVEHLCFYIFTFLKLFLLMESSWHMLASVRPVFSGCQQHVRVKWSVFIRLERLSGNRKSVLSSSEVSAEFKRLQRSVLSEPWTQTSASRNTWKTLHFIQPLVSIQANRLWWELPYKQLQQEESVNYRTDKTLRRLESQITQNREIQVPVVSHHELSSFRGDTEMRNGRPPPAEQHEYI